MAGLLYPAYQKMYSALSFFNRFKTEANFFDNISSLDSFFSEYRNITFVIQSQLKHTEFNSVYERNREKYLTDHWFVEKRNETCKQHPFQLVKKIRVSVFLPFDEITIVENEFSVENDIPMIEMQNEIKDFLAEFLDEEVFLSVSFSFFENGDHIDLIDKILSGISSMKAFLNSMYDEIGQKCALCEELKTRIGGMPFCHIPRDFLLSNDYVYYRNTKTFHKAKRLSLLSSGNVNKIVSRRPLSEMKKDIGSGHSIAPFDSFTLIHSIIRTINPCADIMPAIMVIYADDTYDLDAFHADIKTTLYRKLHEVSTIIDQQDVVEVCFVSLYSVLPISDDIPVYSKDRLSEATSDILVCASIDNQLNEKEYVFEGESMNNKDYISSVLKKGPKANLEVSRINMFPIWRAFKRKKEVSDNIENEET